MLKFVVYKMYPKDFVHELNQLYYAVSQPLQLEHLQWTYHNTMVLDRELLPLELAGISANQMSNSQSIQLGLTDFLSHAD